MTGRPSPEAIADAERILGIAYQRALYAPLDDAVEAAVRAGGPSREEIRERLLVLRYGEQVAS